MIVADEVVFGGYAYSDSQSHLTKFYEEESTGVLKAKGFVHARSCRSQTNPRFRLNAASGTTTTARYAVGSGGFTFYENDRNADLTPYFSVDTGSVRIDPYEDYSFATNSFMKSGDNQTFFIFGGATLTLGTSDFDDPSVARTVTCEGGIGSYAGGALVVDGCGTLLFNTGGGFLGSIAVQDTATILFTDITTPATSGSSMTVGSGATLKTSRTSTLAIGSSLTMEDGAILDLDVSGLGEDVAAVTLNGFTPPESGSVVVKATGYERGTRTLLANLPEGVTKANFSLDRTGIPARAALAVQDGNLVIHTQGMILIFR